MLIKACDDGVIKHESYAKYLATFASRNLTFTSIDVESLAIIAEDSDWQTSDELVAMMSTLGENESDLSASFKVAINFLCLSLSSKPTEQIIYTILNGITRNYCRTNSTEIVAAFIGASEYINQIMGDNMARWYLNRIYKWCQGHFISDVFFKKNLSN